VAATRARCVPQLIAEHCLPLVPHDLGQALCPGGARPTRPRVPDGDVQQVAQQHQASTEAADGPGDVSLRLFAAKGVDGAFVCGFERRRHAKDNTHGNRNKNGQNHNWNCNGRMQAGINS
jgi:hypothetical protein